MDSHNTWIRFWGAGHDDVAEELDALWRERYGPPQSRIELPRLAEELPENHAYFEGAVTRIEINAYERNPAARRACVAHFGATCRVCGFDFERSYGPVGRDFIHVHHLKRLAAIGEEYELDPIRDLRPVCPNCHAMIHRQEPPLKIKVLRGIVREIRERRRSQRARARKTR
jgi:predicted HNH restriction endonuclease